jgi:hypothetical protein
VEQVDKMKTPKTRAEMQGCIEEAKAAGLSKSDKIVFTWAQINQALMAKGYAAPKIAGILSQLVKDAKDRDASKHSLTR